MLMSKNVHNDVSKGFAYSRMLVVSSLGKRPKSEQNKREKLRDSVKTQGEASSIRN